MVEGDQIPSALGDELRRLRHRRGLSVRGLARAAGIDATGVSRLENGHALKPMAVTLMRLAAVLNVDVADLYAAAGYKPAYELPALRPYLRAKYDLPVEAVDHLAAHFELLNEKSRLERGAGDGQRDR